MSSRISMARIRISSGTLIPTLFASSREVRKLMSCRLERCSVSLKSSGVKT
jgi:hypothetical protein